MILRIGKAILVAAAAWLLLMFFALVLGLLPIGETFAAFIRQYAIAIAVLIGLWWGINGGWTWNRGPN